MGVIPIVNTDINKRFDGTIKLNKMTYNHVLKLLSKEEVIDDQRRSENMTVAQKDDKHKNIEKYKKNKNKIVRKKRMTKGVITCFPHSEIEE